MFCASDQQRCGQKNPSMRSPGGASVTNYTIDYKNHWQQLFKDLQTTKHVQYLQWIQPDVQCRFQFVERKDVVEVTKDTWLCHATSVENAIEILKMKKLKGIKSKDQYTGLELIWFGVDYDKNNIIDEVQR